ncbi:ATPase [Streptomyces sp. DSM 42041]|uniref:ATPase n=1 Tax=Streptomyces hazeniae TaxID=3075538 RepID=A0ABU2NN37_9ACTN|nr:BadF/BadG/BcrA/BcrD ATPase family protein [Streptomyces sp. DSM 42041]MDT0377633.1 ATPase [Streptomyces sp. DSM 42041]
MAVTAACLAVDAGNSKTDVAVVGGDGTVLGRARGGGFQPPAVGVGAALDALAATVARAARAAGCDSGSGAPFADDVTACLANADLPREERELADAVRARGWGRETHVLNDTFALLRAGLPDDAADGHGVAVVCGAGINCVGRDGGGRTHRFPAVGRLSGDWGGGGGLADEAVWHAARAADGRGDRTALAEALPAHFGLRSMGALIEAFHLGDLPPARRLEAAPLLFAVAADGDPVARSLVRRQADEVVALAGVTLEALALTDRPTPVVLGGGILTAGHALLDGWVRDGLAARAPHAVPHVVTAPPVLGAALLGLDRAGAPRAAYARLRAA